MLKTLKRYLRYTSWPIIAAMLALIGIGAAAIHASQRATGAQGESASTHLIYAAVALGAFVVAVIVPHQRVGRSAYAMFALTILVLVGVLFTQPVKGATRWVNLRLINVQPSEIAKLTYILMLAWYLRFGDHYRRFSGLVVPFALAFAAMGLILVEPDLGTALLFLPTLYFMLFMAGAKLRHLLLIVGMGLAVVFLPTPRKVDGEQFAAQVDGFTVSAVGPFRFYSVDESLPWSRRPETPIAYCRVRLAEGRAYDVVPLALRAMRGHQLDRINGWLRQDDPRVARQEGFQLRWSVITLAVGGWAGQGRGNRGEGRADMLPVALGQLPHDRTDFIFSVIGGRWGLVGCLAVLGLYAVIFLFGLEIATVTYDPFARLLAVGVLGLLLSQIFINVGMTMGLMPITGMTLPLVSYGGSSLAVNCAALGLLVNVGQRRSALLAPHPFEYGRKRDRQASIDSARMPRPGRPPAGRQAGDDG